MTPQLWIVAGRNGAGKSTLAGSNPVNDAGADRLNTR